MSITPRALIADALYELNVYATGESVTPGDEQLAFRHANRMIDGWGVQRLTMLVEARVTKTWTSGTASYTIGTGGGINVVRPAFIARAGLIIDTGATTPIERKVDVLSDEEYAQWPMKSLGVSPSWAVFYDHSYSAGLGNVYLLPVPTVNTTQLVLYLPTALVPFADLTTPLTFAPGYEDALFYQLVKRLQTPFARQASAETLEAARTSLAWVKRGNMRLTELSVDRALWPSRRGSLTKSQFASGAF